MNIKRNKLDLLDKLEKRWGACQRCRLHENRSNIVHWRGNPDSGLLIIGEAPGADEDAEGRPFVGRCGKLLDEMLALAGLDPAEDVVITNMVACRPPGNRKPERDELKACSLRLRLFIRIVEPRVIVLLGATAAKLAGVYSISANRGTVCEVDMAWDVTIKAVPTFHPSYLLRTHDGEQRRNVIRDFELASRLSRQ